MSFSRLVNRLRFSAVLWMIRQLPAPRRRSGVLLIASGGLGDNVLLSRMLPRFESLAGPNERLCLLVRSDAAAISFLFPNSIEVMTYDWMRFRRRLLYRLCFSYRLHRRAFRLVVGTDYDQHPFVDAYLVAATGAESFGATARPSRKFEREFEQNRRIFTHLLKSDDTPTHRFVRLNELANWVTGRSLPLPSLAEARPPRDRGPNGSRLVVIHPFSSDARKNVKPEIFQAVLRALPGNTRVMLSAAPDDLRRCPEYRVLLADPRVSVDESPIENKFGVLLHAADLVVTVDTMLAHLAVVAGVPIICIASAAYLDWTVPYDPRMTAPHARFIVVPVDCAGCLGSCRYPLEFGRFRCVADQSPDRVVAELNAALS
jgi:ADP-heptose:LPS heptosyltransferase